MNRFINTKQTTYPPTILQKTGGTPAEHPAVNKNESQKVEKIPTGMILCDYRQKTA